jgi:predicted RNase H-like nuclease (RuvC/YqgF family)
MATEMVAGNEKNQGKAFGFTDVLAVAHWTGMDQKIIDLLKSWGISAELPTTLNDFAERLTHINDAANAKLKLVEDENQDMKQRVSSLKMQLQNCSAQCMKLENEVKIIKETNTATMRDTEMRLLKLENFAAKPVAAIPPPPSIWSCFGK